MYISLHCQQYRVRKPGVPVYYPALSMLFWVRTSYGLLRISYMFIPRNIKTVGHVCLAYTVCVLVHNAHNAGYLTQTQIYYPVRRRQWGMYALHAALYVRLIGYVCLTYINIYIYGCRLSCTLIPILSGIILHCYSYTVGYAGPTDMRITPHYCSLFILYRLTCEARAIAHLPGRTTGQGRWPNLSCRAQLPRSLFCRLVRVCSIYGAPASFGGDRDVGENSYCMPGRGQLFAYFGSSADHRAYRHVLDQ